MKTKIIAEIGINHNGDLNIAKRLIDVAVVAGCDAVKFQKRTPDICVPEFQKDKLRETPWGTMTYLKYKKYIEFGQRDYEDIDKYCDGRIQWSASPWDMPSLNFLKRFDVPFLKIPSAMLTNKELLTESTKWCVKHSKELILSTGMSTSSEIDTSVRTVINNSDPFWFEQNFYLLHCNSSYPAPLEELNLRRIQTLRQKYGCKVGYSGHEFRLGTSVATVYLGASLIERHITLDRSMWGTDQLSSVEPQGLIKLVSGIRELEKALGDGIVNVTESEKPVREKLRG